MNILTQVILPLILAFMMFTLGLDLKIQHFKNVFKAPRAFVAGLLLQMLSLPIIGIGLAYLFRQWGMSEELAIGLAVVAACPGGVTSNMLTHFSRADSALSVSLTAATSLLSVVSLPILTGISIELLSGSTGSYDLPVLKTVLGVFGISTLPVLIGLLINEKRPEIAVKIEPLLRKVAAVFFVVIVFAAIAKDWEILVSEFMTVGPAVILLNLAAMLIAAIAARALKLSRPQETALIFECGLQNGTLGIFITLSLIGNEAMMLPSAFYSLWMFLSAGVLYFFLREKTD